jgi:predicted RecA/RadA family phage recombinase
MFQPVASARLSNPAYTGYSTAAWYMLADPADAPVMEVGFLDGKQEPIIETAQADFNTLGSQMRGHIHFGTKKAEYRGGVKMAGGLSNILPSECVRQEKPSQVRKRQRYPIMAQTPVTFRTPGDALDYTPSADVAAGAVVLIGNKVMISKRAISANVKGALHVKGVFRFPKDASVFAAGDAVYWNATGNPVGGTAGSGAATSTPTANFAGYVPPDGAALTGDATVDVKLAASELSATSGVAATIPTATVAATGNQPGHGRSRGDRLHAGDRGRRHQGRHSARGRSGQAGRDQERRRGQRGPQGLPGDGRRHQRDRRQRRHQHGRQDVGHLHRV